MSDQDKGNIQAVGAGLIGFVVVVGLGGAVLMIPRGGSSAKSAATPAAVDSTAALSVPASTVGGKTAADGAPMGESRVATASPAPVLPAGATVDEAVVDAPAAANPARATATGAASPKLVAGAHVDMTGSARSSAKATVGSAARTTEHAAAKKAFVAPRLDLSKTTAVASSVHYAVNSRSELMGRAAGPVYNFGGKGMNGAQGGALAAAAMQTVDEAQTKLEKSDLVDADKAALGGELNSVKTSVKTAVQNGQ